MKSKLLWLFALIIPFALTGCFKSTTSENSAPAENTASETATAQPATDQNTNTQNADNSIGFAVEDEYIVFSVNRSIKLEPSAWLGVIPTGKIYKSERDADDVDIYYAYIDNYDEENAKDYIFRYNKQNIQDIEDGTYDLVLCSSDDEEIGQVVIQVGIEIKGSTITIDYENKK